jgi:TetR/AcrR family fatty acid metabolism transcriptional regulator
MATAAEPATKRRRREETRQRLLDAALPVFARNGFERATVDEIVREAGYSKGAFYVHFESKEDLFWAMLEERIEAVQDTLRGAIDIGVPIAENQRRILNAIFSLDREEKAWSALFMEFAAHAARNEKVRARLAEMYQRWRSFTVEMLRGAREAGKIRADIDIEFTASMIIAIMEGTLIQSRVAPDAVRPAELIKPMSALLASWLEP